MLNSLQRLPRPEETWNAVLMVLDDPKWGILLRHEATTRTPQSAWERELIALMLANDPHAHPKPYKLFKQRDNLPADTAMTHIQAGLLIEMLKQQEH